MWRGPTGRRLAWPTGQSGTPQIARGLATPRVGAGLRQAGPPSLWSHRPAGERVVQEASRYASVRRRLRVWKRRQPGRDAPHDGMRRLASSLTGNMIGLFGPTPSLRLRWQWPHSDCEAGSGRRIVLHGPGRPSLRCRNRLPSQAACLLSKEAGGINQEPAQCPFSVLDLKDQGD